MGDSVLHSSLSHAADEDLARRSRASALVYVALFAVVAAFTPYLDDSKLVVVLAGSAIVLAAITRTWLVLRFDAIYRRRPDAWLRGYLVLTLVMSGVWGMFCANAVIEYGLQWTAMLLLLGTAGIAAGAITTLSIQRALVMPFLVLLLLPPTAAAGYLLSREAVAVTLMFVTYSAFMFVVANRINTEYWTALNNAMLLDHRARELEASNQELESYSYSIAHDLRTPLRSIIGFSQILLEDRKENDSKKDKEKLERIIEAGKRMARLIDEILELSRITRKDLERSVTDLSALAESHAAMLAEADPHGSAKFRIQPGLRAVGDPKLLNLALQNLITNAWKFTSGKDGAEIVFDSVVENGETVYSIRDNGVGFDMAYSHKLFKPFERLHGEHEFPGNGVGLATVQRIVLRHGGRIWAQSQPGEGAVFHFTLTV